MNKREAERLARRIRSDAPSLRTTAREIGNGEWVCVLNGSIWIWDEDDWEANKGTATIAVKRMIA